MRSTFSGLAGFLLSGLTIAGGMLFAGPVAAQTETLYGLTASGQLFSFRNTTPGVTASPAAISGVAAGQVLVGMDFRPATGGLYALGYEVSTGAAQLYLVNVKTAGVTPVGAGVMLAANVTGAQFGFDFIPTVDRIRVVSRNGDNYRLDPDTGALVATDPALVFAAADVNFGGPGVVGLASDHNVAGAATTTLYGYDFGTDSLVTIGSPSPNDGTAHTVGATGITAANGAVGLDISGATGIFYGNVHTVAGDGFYRFDAATGAAMLVGTIGAGLVVLDLSVQPGSAIFPAPDVPLAITLKTKRKVVTTRPVYTIKGGVTVGAAVAFVEVKVGAAKFRRAKGTASWSFPVRLAAGVNRVVARAVAPDGSRSAPVKATILRE